MLSIRKTQLSHLAARPSITRNGATSTGLRTAARRAYAVLTPLLFLGCNAWEESSDLKCAVSLLSFGIILAYMDVAEDILSDLIRHYREKKIGRKGN